MTAPKFTPWKVGGRVGSTAREGLVGLYAIDREKPNKYQGNAVAYAHSLDDARLAAAAPELYAALRDIVELHDRGHIEGLSNHTEGETGTLRKARAALAKAVRS